MWEALVNIMTEIAALYRVMLEISKSRKQALVLARVEEIEALTKQEESLILQIGKLESSREQTAAELAAMYALPPKELTISKAQELAGGDIAAKLQRLETDLTNILAELIPLNKTNTVLIQQSLNYVNFNLNLLTQSPANPNYAAKGQGEPQRPRAVIDAKV